MTHQQHRKGVVPKGVHEVKDTKKNKHLYVWVALKKKKKKYWETVYNNTNKLLPALPNYWIPWNISLDAERFLKCTKVKRDHICSSKALSIKETDPVKEVETTFQRREGRYSDDSSQGIMPFTTFSLDLSTVKGKTAKPGLNRNSFFN